MADSSRRRRRWQRALVGSSVLAFCGGLWACSLGDLDDLTRGDGSVGGPEPGVTTASGLFVPPAGQYTYVQNTAAYARPQDFPNATTETLGVDRLTTHGGVKVRLKRAQASILAATIRVHEASDEGTCWTLRIDITPDSAKGGHQEEETFCARDGSLFGRLQGAAIQDQAWAIEPLGVVSTTSTTDCAPSTTYLTASMKPGDTWHHQCTGSATLTKGPFTSDGPYTYVRREMLTIDGVQEQVRHVRRERAIAGGVTGTEVTEFYLSVQDGLPLRIRRYTHISTPVSLFVVSDVDFDNDGSDWLLRSRAATPLPPEPDAGEGDLDGGMNEPSDAGGFPDTWAPPVPHDAGGGE